MSTVNYIAADKVDTAYYWAHMSDDAERALNDISAQRMALDLEVARLRRDGITGYGYLESWADTFAQMEKDLERFIDQCDQKRENRYNTEKNAGS